MREIQCADNLVADVEGDIEEVAGVLRITSIRLSYKLNIPTGTLEKVERVLAAYADNCPAYQSVKESISCSWELEATEI